MESRKDLLVFNVQAFSWASHLEHLDLEDDIWNGTLRTENERGEPSNPVYRSGQRSFNSRPAWIKSKARQGILERVNWDGKILVRQRRDSRSPSVLNTSN